MVLEQVEAQARLTQAAPPPHLDQGQEAVDQQQHPLAVRALVGGAHHPAHLAPQDQRPLLHQVAATHQCMLDAV